MNYKFSCTILLFSMITSFVKETKVIEKDASTPIGINQNGYTGGTDSTGGGNSVNGKPVDDYILNLRKIDTYNQYLKPLVINLEKNYPYLAGDFKHLIHRRMWYFVPGDIDAISSSIIGTYAKTDQLALQDLNKIWIDNNLFNKMDSRSQAVLIVHEIFMGIKLLQFKSKQDLCIAKAARLIEEENITNTQEKYFSEVDFCTKTYPQVPGLQSESFSLNKNDYDYIRMLVYKIMSDQPYYSELKTLIETSGFRTYEN